MNSAFRAIWLVPQSRDMKYYSPPGGFWAKKMSRKTHFIRKWSNFLGIAIKLVLYILKQLFASVSVTSGGYLPRRSGSVNIHHYSPPLLQIIVNCIISVITSLWAGSHPQNPTPMESLLTGYTITHSKSHQSLWALQYHTIFKKSGAVPIYVTLCNSLSNRMIMHGDESCTDTWCSLARLYSISCGIHDPADDLLGVWGFAVRDLHTCHVLLTAHGDRQGRNGEQTTILDKSPWDSLKIWHVFPNRSVFDALEGRVCTKWRPPSPLVNVAPKKCTFSPLIQHWEGEGEIEEGRFSAKKCRCPNTFVQDCLSWTTKTKVSITSQWFIVLPPNLDWWVFVTLCVYWVCNGLIGIVLARDVCDYDVGASVSSLWNDQVN